MLASCGTGEDTAAPPAPAPARAEPAPARTCPEARDADRLLPGVKQQHLELGYWLERLALEHDLDRALLTADELGTLEASLAVPRAKFYPQRDLLAPLDAAELASKVDDRRTWAREKLADGAFVGADGVAFDAASLASLDYVAELATATPVVYVALADVQLRCAPIAASFYAPVLDLRLDKNACSVVRAQDVLRVVAEWPNGMRLAQARYSFGWIGPDAALSPPVPAERLEALVHGDRAQVVAGPLEVAGVTVAEGTLLPIADTRGQRAYVATSAGFEQTGRKQAGQLRATRRPLTRRAFLEEAWRYLGTPYGLGGTDGGRDCSRLVLDVFESFGLHLPRHSSWQARAGSFWIEVDEISATERMLLIDAASRKGIVLLHFPGHIMIYVGRDDADEPMALHAFAEYVEPCEGGFEQLVRVKEVTVSNLQLGADTSRKSFLERITHISVLGEPPGVELGGVAEVRPTADPVIPPDRKCRDSRKAAIYVMPERPNKEQPLRVVVSTSEDPGPAKLTLIDPKGEQHHPDSVRLGGPPYGRVATVPTPRTGVWKAVFADGDNVVACQRIRVGSRRPELAEPSDGPVWYPRYKWSVANENLYALFVERLFDYPMDEDHEWPNLHTLLRDPERNILFDYRGLDEDNLLELEPDCADLPYTLRAYFAWKLRLPFGYRRCTRARGGRPPDCDKPGAGDNLMSRLELKDRQNNRMLPHDDIESFALFVNHHVRRAVHSSSGRTAAEDDLSDFYPVRLTRESLRPGTTFADPYGHLLIVADWIPQGSDRYGILVGADAQPDGTVGRRRFWRGSFLFDPKLGGAGAGFKAFRPRVFVEEPTVVDLELSEQELVQIARVGYLQEVLNEELLATRDYTRYSTEQYSGSSDDFYAAMEGLINPRPLDPEAMQAALVDALHEAVRRRVTSVDNGERYMAEHANAVVAMPEGSSIFLTSGAWEDYSTPSRDLRLLISIDSVVQFPARVRATPERFGLRAGEGLDEDVAAVERVLQDRLAALSIEYTRSDGSKLTLSLADIAARAERFELAYNPNDCIEIRWGAAAGSDELSTCKRHAPAEQRERMESYRGWFATRQRPPR